MNYRHAYHAGNFADVFKHVLLRQAVRHLAAKPSPFVLIDTHAGIGLYDLQGDEAGRTGESAGGITRLRAEADPPEAVAEYLAAVAAENPEGDGGIRHYPGSPRLLAPLLRLGDRLLLAEMHPDDARTLDITMGRDRRIRVHAGDGYKALKGWVPPPERRGLVLIDPPFENRDEFQTLVLALTEALKRWRTGTYVIWYPIKDWLESESFLAALADIPDMPPTWVAKLMIRGIVPGLPRLDGCGMVFVNPPWAVLKDAETVLPYLARVLAAGEGAEATADWLVPEG